MYVCTLYKAIIGRFTKLKLELKHETFLKYIAMHMCIHSTYINLRSCNNMDLFVWLIGILVIKNRSDGVNAHGQDTKSHSFIHKSSVYTQIHTYIHQEVHGISLDLSAFDSFVFVTAKFCRILRMIP